MYICTKLYWFYATQNNVGFVVQMQLKVLFFLITVCTVSAHVLADEQQEAAAQECQQYIKTISLATVRLIANVLDEPRPGFSFSCTIFTLENILVSVIYKTKLSASF